MTSAVFCGLAGRPILVGVVDASTAVFSATALFGGMALLGELFRRRLLEPSAVPAHVAYGRGWAGMRHELLTREYIATVALTLIAAPLFLAAFSAAKQAIPALHPFTWDATLSAWGSRFGGGRPLWRQLQPILGKPDITVSLDWFYHRAWTTLMMAAFVWTSLLRPSYLRRRYLVAFAAAFLVIGSWLALALSSAGPAYFDAVTSGSRDPYAGLLEYLRSVDAQSPLLSVRGEDALLVRVQPSSRSIRGRHLRNAERARRHRDPHGAERLLDFPSVGTGPNRDGGVHVRSVGRAGVALRARWLRRCGDRRSSLVARWFAHPPRVG